MAEPDESTLLEVAASISEGIRIDWDHIDQPKNEPEAADVLRELRLLDAIATFHRTTPSPSVDGVAALLDESWRPTEPSAGGRRDPGAERDDLQTWGQLTILQKIGEGAFGTVYRAQDLKLQREVALKLLAPSAATAASASRALKEARLLARLRHPNVATVYGADHIEGRVGLWMEFVNGRTLAQILRSHGAFSPREAALVGLDLCRAIAAVHGAGLIHGDIKAHNVMREEGGRTVLMDFGTGKDLISQGRRGPGPVDDFAGTPLYLAPEVFEGRPRTKVTDIYGLGVLLFHLVTDSYPVDGRTREEVERAHRAGARQQLRDLRPDLPEAFVHAVERALATEPLERYQSAGAFETALARFLGASGETTPGWLAANWRHLAVGSAALAIAAAIAVPYWMFGRDRPPTGANANVADTASRTDAAAPALAAAAGAGQAYTINTALYREQGGQEVRLRSGGRVSPGDQLFVEVNATVPTYVYIVNEDEHGESFLLYPLPGQNVTNPLPPGKANRLPGARGKDEIYWKVTNAGGREHFLIFASPERLSVFEQLFASLPRPDAAHPVEGAKISRTALTTLRSVGGLAAVSDSQPLTSGPLTKQFTTPLGDTEENVRGLWVRQLTLENPAK